MKRSPSRIRPLLPLSLLLAAIWLHGSLQAEIRSIAIPNHSFEQTPGDPPPQWTHIPSDVSSGIVSKSSGAIETGFIPGAIDGSHFLEIALGLGNESNLPNPYSSAYGYSADLGPFRAETTYTLTVAVHVQDEWHTRWRDAGIGFRADDEIVAMNWYGGVGRPAEGYMLPIAGTISSSAFSDRTITISTTANPALVGRRMTVVLGHRGNGAWLRGVHFDNVRLLADGPLPDLQPVTTPANLTATAQSHASLTLTWQNQTSHESGFEIERQTSGGSFVRIAVTGPGLTSYTDSGLAASTQYSYRVRAFNSLGESAWSQTATSTTLAGPKPAKMALGTNFWNFAWSGRSHYFVDGVNWATVENPWRSDFLDQIRIYRVIRFMDQIPTNNSTQRTWSQRTAKTANHYNTANGAVAWEWMIDLCNRVGADMWVTVPHLTIEGYEANPESNYWTDLASLIRQQLDPNLKVYVEYSNETWNGGFTQATYSAQRGIQMGFHHVDMVAGFYFHVYAAMRLHHAFLTVFADQPERVKTVIAGWDGTPGGTTTMVNALNNRSQTSRTDTRLNPWNLRPDYLAIASYISTGDGAAPNIRQLWSEHLASRLLGYQDQLKAIAGTGMRMIAYEGGQHYLTNAHLFSQNPQSYDMYLEWLEAVDEYFDLNAHYTHLGTWASGGAWGAKTSTNQPIEQAHRYRALVDYAARYVAPENRLPETPLNLTASALSSSEVSLSWVRADRNELGFRLERSQGGGFVLAAETEPETTEFTDSGLEPNTTYLYRVAAFNAAGLSIWSEEVSVTTAPASPLCGSLWTAASTADLGPGFKWNSLGYIYDGFSPFYFLFNYGEGEWIYAFGCPETGQNETSGFFIYDFRNGEFGFLYTALLPYYIISGGANNGSPVLLNGHPD